MLDGDVLELRFYGFVGDDFGYGQRITAQAVGQALDANPHCTSIKLRVNSPGGTADEGIAIKNLLASKKIPIECTVDGVAASAASLLLMGPKDYFTVKMARDARLMIHEASTYTAGGVSDHQKAINGLKALNDGAADVYAARCGKTMAEVADMMAQETWMTAAQAVEQGFADSVIESDAEPMMRVDLAKMYRHAPALLMVAAGDPPAEPVAKPQPAAAAPKPAAPVSTIVDDPSPPAESSDGVSDQQLQTFVQLIASATALDRDSAIAALNTYSNDVVSALTRRLQPAAVRAAASNQGINPGTMSARKPEMADQTQATPAADPSAGAEGAAALDPEAEARAERIERAQMKSQLEELQKERVARAEAEKKAKEDRIKAHVASMVANGQIKPEMVADAEFLFASDWARGERVFGTITPLVGPSRSGTDPHASDAAIDPEKATEKDLDAAEVRQLNSMVKTGMKRDFGIKYLIKNRAQLRAQRAAMGL